MKRLLRLHLRAAGVAVALAVSHAAVACSVGSTDGDTGNSDDGGTSIDGATASTDAASDAVTEGGTIGPSTDGSTNEAGTAGPDPGGAVHFGANAPNQYDYGKQTVLPTGFGEGEFTCEVRIHLDKSFATGPAADGAPEQLLHWYSGDPAPYSRSDWWYKGNFLLDGHNNSSFGAGTFSLQVYGGGRIRWLFGDGEAAGPGDLWAVQAHPAGSAVSLLDDAWHRVTLARRFKGTSNAGLELWIDGALIDEETTTGRTNMRTYWNTWAGFPPNQDGWFWGAEKQAAIGALSQYEDYKGLVGELLFWSRARSAAEIGSNAAIVGTEEGLVGYYRFDEGAGTKACDALHPTHCITFHETVTDFWRP